MRFSQEIFLQLNSPYVKVYVVNQLIYHVFLIHTLNLKSTQADKVSHDEEYYVVIFENISNNLGNLFGDVETSNESVDSKNFNMINNDLV